MYCYGQRIKAVRLLRGLTLKDVATAIGVQEATIQRYESGKIRNIPQEKLFALAEVLGTSKEYLMGIGNDNGNDIGADQFIDWLLTPSETAGNNIKSRRISLQMKVEDLAKKVGVSKQTIYRYETGKLDNISPRILKNLAASLQTSIAFLLGKADDPLDMSPSALSIDALFSSWANSEDEGTSEGKRSNIFSLNENESVALAKADLLVVVNQICSFSGEITSAKIKTIIDFLKSNEKILKSLVSTADLTDKQLSENETETN